MLSYLTLLMLNWIHAWEQLHRSHPHRRRDEQRHRRYPPLLMTTLLLLPAHQLLVVLLVVLLMMLLMVLLMLLDLSRLEAELGRRWSGEGPLVLLGVADDVLDARLLLVGLAREGPQTCIDPPSHCAMGGPCPSRPCSQDSPSEWAW